MLAAFNHKITSDGFTLFGAFMMMLLFKGVLVSAAGPAPNYDMQKILSTRSPREAALMSGFVSIVLMPVRYLLVAGFAVLAIAYFDDLGIATASAGDYDRILPAAMRQFAPPGVLGLIVAGLLAAFISTFAATLNAAPAYLVNDVYRRCINPQASRRRLIYLSYAVSIAFVYLSAAIGLYIPSINSLLIWIVSGLWGGYTAANVLKWYWWRFNGYGFFVGMLVGMIGALALPPVLGPLFPQIAADVFPLYSFPLLLLLSLAGCLIATLLTPPDDMEMLKKFYRNVRPWGFWGPVRDAVLAEDPQFPVNRNFRRDAFNIVVGTVRADRACRAADLRRAAPLRRHRCLPRAGRRGRRDPEEDLVRPAGDATEWPPDPKRNCRPPALTATSTQQQREYVITEPLTPLPWINYLGGKALHSIISNTGGGYSFYRDAKLRRLTRYRYDSVPLDSVGKYLYIADGDATWNPGFRPTRTPLDRYECRHGLGYTRFRSAKNGLAADLLVFVADDDDAELQVLTLRNETRRAEDGANLLVRRVVPLERRGRRLEPAAQSLARGMPRERLDGLPRHRLPRAARALRLSPREPPRSTASIPTAAPSSVTTAISPIPAAVRARRSGNSQVNGWWPIASLSLPVTLRRANPTELVFATGYAENAPAEKWASDGSPNVAAARRLRARLQDADSRRARVRRPSRAAGTPCSDALQVKTPDPQLERAGQHLESVPVHGDVPARAQRLAVRDRPWPRHRLPRLEPGLPRRRAHGAGRGSRAPDAPRRHAEERRQRLSPVPAAHAHRQQRDRRRIQRRSAVARAQRRGLRARDRPRGPPRRAVPFEDAPDGGATMRDHLEASLRYTLERLGAHGLPLIGRADWNDCLNLNAHSTRSRRVVPDRADAHRAAARSRS